MQYETRNTESHEEVTPVEARQGRRVGVWKILAASLVLVVVGFLIMGGLFDSGQAPPPP
ncbi:MULTISPECIES: hypothetical protein [Hyphomonas]|uniref:hypothetical protein n=1 Tax=Hyphomonas TaxID=85 RepID=UPI000AAA843F|nr:MULTISPECIES: hypothetical protein [Hyphomonas]